MRINRIAALCAAAALSVLLCGCAGAGTGEVSTGAGTAETETEKIEITETGFQETEEKETDIVTEELTTAAETEELTTAEATEAETSMETEVETSKETGGEPVRLRIATYNIKHAAEGETSIAEVIKAMGADIVGVQEVDYLNTRSGGRNQPKLIADAAGMPYYKFTRAIDYKGGQYGTLILSKYPITEYETVQLYSGGNEGRAVGHAVIDVNGIRLDFFNTHLSYEATDVRLTQLEKIGELTSGCRRFIVTADFNSAAFAEFEPVGATYMVNFFGRELVTFPSKGSAIDNILLSDGIEPGDCGTVTESFSDHRPLWSDVELYP